MRSDATTVEEYLAQLEPARAADMRAVLGVIRGAIPAGYVETVNWGMICWEVPLELSGPTYNGQPLAPVALASQKNHISVYLMGVYGSPAVESEFRERWHATQERLDMGKSCVRFRTVARANLDAIGWAAGLYSPAEFVNEFQAARG